MKNKELTTKNTKGTKNKAYPKYKSSGVEWLGDVPEHWGVKKVRRFLLDHKQGYYATDPYTDEGFKLLRISDFDGNGFVNTIDSPSVEKKADTIQFLLKENDFVFARTGGAGSFGIIKGLSEETIFASYLIRFRFSKQTYANYLRYAFTSKQFVQGIVRNIHGGVNQNVHAEDIKDQSIPLPPLPEQQAITAFLDRETGRIDSLIAKKQRLLELLAEQRTALISRAVTKGLDATVKLKPSGVEWLGEVPEHWGVKRLKDLLQTKKGAIKTGPFGSQLLSSEMYDEDVKVYNQKSVITNDFEYGENYISLEKFKDLKEFQTFPGDFLITTRGTIGRCAILPKDAEQGILHPCLMRLQTNKSKVFDRYLEILIEESTFILEQLKIKSNGTTIEVIYQDSLKNVTVLLPPLPEQYAIAAFLDRETAKIDTLSAKVVTVIERLKEYRTALISSVVTGKIDVREAV